LVYVRLNLSLATCVCSSVLVEAVFLFRGH
jgi:hypothetical protein